VRIRLGWGVGPLSPDAASWAVWLVRIVAGWTTVWFIAMFSAGEERA